jgi:xylulokinase
VRHNLEAMARSGTSARRVIAVGGGAASRLWLRIVSDVTGLAQELPDKVIGAAYGDAYLAATAVGLAERDASVGHPWVRIVDRVEPDPATRAHYDARYGLYRSLYRKTRDLVHALVEDAGAGVDQAGSSSET